MAGAAGRPETAARRFADAELDFHRTLVRATGNRALTRLAGPLDLALHTARVVAGVEPAARAATAAEHRRIAAAVRMGAVPRP
jgi:DNA-binding FadR family transcriptional regulator